MWNSVKFLTLIGFIFIFSKKEIQAQTFEGGIIAGFNMSQLDGDDLAGWNQIGLNVGGRVAVTPVDKWHYSLDILFSQKGSNAAPEQFSSYDNVRLNYVEIPFQVNYSDWLSEDGYYRLRFLAGISYSQLVGFKVIRSDGSDTTDLEDYRKNAFNVQLGATYFINEHIGINGQYSYGFFNVENDPNANALVDKALTFRGIYMF